MDKKKYLIEKITKFDNKYFNEDQKKIAISILENSPEEEVQAYADFIFMKRRTGFAFDYSPEIAKGRLITLKEDVKKRINVSDDVNEYENKLIIGDNYNALQSLLVTHKEKIDAIYIDPPYNTESAKTDGNQSSKEGASSKFIYKDKFGRGGWLNMIKARLTLAKDLLSPNGVIFVSIDDSEQAYLKVLMDDIFGEDNFINQLIWVSNKKGRQISNSAFSKTHEYILIYSKKQMESFENYKIDRNWAEKNMPSIYDPKNISINEDEYGQFIFQNELHNTNIKAFNIETRKNLFFPIFTDGNNISTEPKNNWVKLLPPKNGRGIQGVWRWSKNKVDEEHYNLHIVKKNNEYKIYTKVRDMKYSIKDIILSSNMTTKSGTSQIDQLNLNGFNFPKPTNLIKFILKLNKNATILDFFAGSGTTGQAVMELNREDNGNRKFILCTNNENGIADKITYERLHRVIKGKTSEGKNDFNWIKNNKPYSNEKLRVININDEIKISLNQDIDPTIYKEAKDGLRLLDGKYNKENLNLYYDLAALNPLENEKDRFHE